MSELAKKSKKKNTKKKNVKDNAVKNKLAIKKQTGVAFSIKIKNDKVHGTIGNFGKTIMFTVSSDKVLTFNNMVKTVTGRWETHDRIGKKPKTEFIGPGLDSVSMTVELNSMFGVKPLDTIKRIEKAIKKGTAEYLVLGNKKIGSKKYRITDVSETWNTVMRNGALINATLELKFEEYVQ